MLLKDYNKLRRLVKIAFDELQKEAINDGMDLMSVEYEQAKEKIKEQILLKYGFTVEEYNAIQNLKKEINPESVAFELNQLKKSQQQNSIEFQKSVQELSDKIASVDSKVPTYSKLPDKPKIPTTDQIERQIKQATKDLAKRSEIKPLKEVVKEIIVDEETKKDLLELQKFVSEWKLPEPINIEPLKADIKDSADRLGQMEQDLLNMPDFRKLGMGLQGQIDEILSNPSVGTGDMTKAVYDPASIAEQLVGLTATQTLTNKTLTSPNINEAVALTATSTELNILDGATLSTAELNFVDGVTSAIQTQINAKAPSTAPTFATSITGSYLTASEILITDASKNIVSAAVATYPSLTELTYLKGVTSAIQTQINTKANSSGALTQFIGNGNWKVWYSDGSGDVIELALGASGTFLQANGVSSAPTWAVPAGSGDVSKVGTPANNQVGVWTGDGTLEGDAALTFDTTTDTLATVLITATTVTAALTGDVTGNVSGTAATVTGAAQTAITSVGTLTVLQVDNVNINGNTISSTAGTDLLITPLAGQQLILDGTIEIDAGVVTGATSITSTAFVGDLTGNVTGNVSGTSATVTGATQAAITTLAGLVSVQGFTVTLADAGADAILGWDDSAAAYENLTQAEVLAVIGSSSATAQGVVELATDAEAVTGTDTARAVTPANLTARMAAPGTIGGTTAAAITGTNITANTNFLPDANDGAGLGVSGTAFSDLFLASGALIDFAAGNAVITHSSGIITVSTGELRNTTAGTNTASVVTVGGTQTLTNKTLTSPTLTTPGAFTTGGNITLAENTGLVLDPVLSADGQYSASEMIIGTGGATIAFGDLVTLDKDDSRWELVDISVAAAATGDARGIIGIAVTSSTDGGAITVMLRGNIRADANFPALTIGAGVYASTTGDIVVAQPTTEDHVIRIIGFALTADSIYFCPENDWITHVT